LASGAYKLSLCKQNNHRRTAESVLTTRLTNSAVFLPVLPNFSLCFPLILLSANAYIIVYVRTNFVSIKAVWERSRSTEQGVLEFDFCSLLGTLKLFMNAGNIRLITMLIHIVDVGPFFFLEKRPT